MNFRHVILIIILFLCICCKTNSSIKNAPKPTVYENALNYISNDSIFNNKIKSYYPDFSKCEKPNYLISDFIEPIKYQDFPFDFTLMIENIKGFENLGFNEKIKAFDSIYSFPEFLKNFENANTLTSGCSMRLNFAKPVNNLLPMKFTIIDEHIDSTVDYRPREILYILKYDSKNKIIDRDYLFKSH